MTCALAEGQSCGVYTERCAQGLRCLPRQGEEKPLHALLHGRGVCLNEKSYREQAKNGEFSPGPWLRFIRVSLGVALLSLRMAHPYLLPAVLSPSSGYAFLVG